jgi:hypothetical protein
MRCRLFVEFDAADVTTPVVFDLLRVLPGTVDWLVVQACAKGTTLAGNKQAEQSALLHSLHDVKSLRYWKRQHAKQVKQAKLNSLHDVPRPRYKVFTRCGPTSPKSLGKFGTSAWPMLSDSSAVAGTQAESGHMTPVYSHHHHVTH